MTSTRLVGTTDLRGRDPRRNRPRAPYTAVWALLCTLALCAEAQAIDGPADAPPPDPRIVRVTANDRAIPVIRTAPGITTMISLPEPAAEAICGDLYDEQTNAGGFVVQRSGRDVFVKPLSAPRETNLFLKTARATYAFELVVVAQPKAMHVVYVDGAAPTQPFEAERAACERERAELREALVAARAGATAHSSQREELSRGVREQSEQLARSWVEAAVARDGAMMEIVRRARREGGLEVRLGPAVLSVGGRSYLPCVIRNLSGRAVTVSSAEFGGEPARRAALELALKPGESRSAVAVFDGPPPGRVPLRLLGPSRTPLLTLHPFE
jgi:type IV secretory pathway VirB9-like protein